MVGFLEELKLMCRWTDVFGYAGCGLRIGRGEWFMVVFGASVVVVIGLNGIQWERDEEVRRSFRLLGAIDFLSIQHC